MLRNQCLRCNNFRSPNISRNQGYNVGDAVILDHLILVGMSHSCDTTNFEEVHLEREVLHGRVVEISPYHAGESDYLVLAKYSEKPSNLTTGVGNKDPDLSIANKLARIRPELFLSMHN